MSVVLRVILLVAAVLAAFWILFKIRKHKLKMEDAIYWVVFAIILLLIGLFPQIAYWLTGVMGVMSTANLVFLIIIFLLLVKIFMLSLKLSVLEDKIEVLTAEVALRSHDARKDSKES